MDICFPGENGIDIAAKIRKRSPETGIVFLTGSEDYAVDAYTVDALHYLVKPPTEEAVGEAFQRLESFRSRQRPTLSLVVERDSVTVYLDDISYIVSDGHRKEIHLTDGRVLCVRKQLWELEEKLDGNFLKLNKGTIVNMEQIRSMSKDYCLLRDGTELGFTRRERAAIRSAYDQFVYSRLFEKKEEHG